MPGGQSGTRGHRAHESDDFFRHRPPRLDDDDRRVDHARLESPRHPGDHGTGGKAAVGKEDLDHGSCPFLVAEAPACFGEELVVGRREGTTGACLVKCSGAGERTGLDPEDLEVVVEVEHLGTFLRLPLVGGDELSAFVGLDGLGAEQHVDSPAGKADRHRVTGLAHTDP